MKLFLGFLLGLFIVNCDGPRQHEVQGSNLSRFSKSSGLLTFKSVDRKVSFKWLTPFSGSVHKKNQLIIFVYDSQGELTGIPADLQLAFYATMPSMGHPMADAGYFEKLDAGIYLNKNIVFNMDGDWLMQLILYDSNFKQKDKVTWNEFW